MKKQNEITYWMIMILFSFLFLYNSLTAQVGIEFSFANSQITTDGTDEFFEFDILASAEEDTQFYIAQVYLDYNTNAFGNSIVSNNNITLTKGPLLNNIVGDNSIGGYTLGMADNAPSRVSIFNEHTVLGTDFGYEFSNTLGTTPIVYVHVKILIQNNTESSGISFNDQISQYDQQCFFYSTPGTDNIEMYSSTTLGPPLDQPLPVELVYFEAELDSNSVNLIWQTATEVNNYGFEIERRSKFNESEYSDWEKIGFVAGHGTSNSPINYLFVDSNLPNSNNVMYRLKQIDNDGKHQYSKEIEVDLSTITDVEVDKLKNEFELQQNFPNPFNPTTNIHFNLDHASDVTLIIYNMLGEKVATLLDRHLNAGVHRVKFDASNLVSGTYIYSLENGSERINKKMILIK